MKYIVSVVFGLMLIFGASLTVSAERSCCAVSREGGGEKIYFTDKKLYYENGADSPCKSSKYWNAKYDPDTNTLTLSGYKGGTITFERHPDDLPPRIELMYSNTITVTEPDQNGYYSGIYARVDTDSLTITRSEDTAPFAELYITVKPDTVVDGGSLVGIFTQRINEIFTDVDLCISVYNPEKSRELFHTGVYQTEGKVYKMTNGQEVPYNPLLHVLGNSEFIIRLYTAYPKKIIGFDNYAYNGFLHANTTNKIIIDTSDVYGTPGVKGLIVDKAADISVKSKMAYAVQPRGFYTPLDPDKYVYRQVYSWFDSSYDACYRNGKSYELTVDYGKNQYGYKSVTKARYLAGEKVQLDPVYDRRADDMHFLRWNCESGVDHIRVCDDPYTESSTMTMPAFDTTVTAIYSAPVTVVTTGEYADRATVTIRGLKKNTCGVETGDDFYFTVKPEPGYTACDSGEIQSDGGSITFDKREGEVFTYTKTGDAPVMIYVPIRPIDYNIKYARTPKSFLFTKTNSYTIPEEFVSYSYGQTLNLPKNSDVKCNTAGYRLEGWYKKYDTSTGEYSDGPYQSVPVGEIGDITFFAKWVEDANAVYRIIHDSDCSAPKNGGYTISGKSDATAGYKDITFELKPTNGFEIDDTVTPYIYYLRKNSAGGAKITPTKLGKGSYCFDMPEDVKNNVFIYAQDINDNRSAFKLSTYTITYDPNGGEKSEDFDRHMPQTYTIEDDLYLEPRYNTITRRGYKFKYWCFDAECSTAPIYYIKRGNIYRDVTLYAKWEPEKYTVNVYTDGKKGNVSEYGSVVQSHTNAYADNEITVWAEPKEGCMVRLLYVYGKNSSQRIYPSEGENHSYTFTMSDENAEVHVYFSPYCTVTTSESPLYTIKPIYDPQNLDFSAEKMPKGHTYKFYLNLAPGSYKTENFAITANGVPVSYKEEDGFYYTVISEDTTIEVTGIDSGKINITASVSENTLTAYTEIYSGYDLYEKVGICAVYDENGKLLQMQTDKLNTDSGTTVKTHTFDLTDVPNQKLTVKYFVWNSLETLSPFLAGGEYVVSRE